MLIDTFFPRYDFHEWHEIRVTAPPDRVFGVVQLLDMSDSRVIRALFRLRGMRRSALTLDGLQDLGFLTLGEVPGEELVLGLVGRFWTRPPNLLAVDPAEFRDFQTSGFAKVAWNFRVSATPQGATTLTTETRVRCLDPASRRVFRLYWLLIRPFSGWIRGVESGRKA